jgi:hypothetical protein
MFCSSFFPLVLWSHKRPEVALWLRRCATSRTVPGSIPGGVIGFFSYIFPSDRTMALGSTQPLVKMSTRNIPGGKGGRCARLTTSPPSRAECHEIWKPKPPGTLWTTPGLLRDSFTFTFVSKVWILLLIFCFHRDSVEMLILFSGAGVPSVSGLDCHRLGNPVRRRRHVSKQ